MPPSTAPLRLHFIANSPVAGLAVAERRVESPRATLICVHGALDRGGSFSRLARRLEHFDVVAYDRRGYQGSRGLQPSDLEHHVTDLLALIRREEPGRPIILLGHSFGGVVTICTAIKDPSRINLLINYESPAPWILHRPNAYPPLTENSPAEVERFFRRVVSDVAWDRLSEVQRESRRLDAPALLSDLGTVRQEHAPFDIANLRAPLTYVYGTGDADAASYFRALTSAMSARNPLVTAAEIPDARHAAHLDHPRLLATLVEERWDACASG
ncbi:MAG TPA: alpha/beta fold hydrolase [Acidimicrobiales bacterium]|jgi:pimeloyl-ACP methyl ester carboxylesterase|nr:alpha/beta fold hydrolase [Acidimicrobiales bacterium]